MTNGIKIITREDTKTYYDNRFGKLSQNLNEEETLRWKSIEKLIMEISKSNKLNIADFGCGRGWLSNKLSAYGEVTGFDISEEAINNAKNAYPNIRFVCLDASQPIDNEFSNKFNLVLSSEIIEHIIDQKVYLQNIKFLLCDGGNFVLTTPNGIWKSVFYVGERLNWKQPIENWRTSDELKKLISEIGLKQTRQTTFNAEWIFDFKPDVKYKFLAWPLVRKVIKFVGIYGAIKLWLNKKNYGLNILITGSK